MPTGDSPAHFCHWLLKPTDSPSPALDAATSTSHSSGIRGEQWQGRLWALKPWHKYLQPDLQPQKVYLTSLKIEWQLRKNMQAQVHYLKMVTSSRKPGGRQGRKGWSSHLNIAITQLLTFQVSFLRRNWNQSNNTGKRMEIIVMAQKQRQKSFYVPPFNKRKSNFETAASQTQAHALRQGLGLVLFLFISQFPCLFSFFPLPVAARAAQGK